MPIRTQTVDARPRPARYCQHMQTPFEVGQEVAIYIGHDGPRKFFTTGQVAPVPEHMADWQGFTPVSVDGEVSMYRTEDLLHWATINA